MNQRQLGNSDLQVSEVGLGCWQLGGDFGPIEEQTVGAIIETALDKQVNFFDTADVYGAGASERFLGQRLSQSEPRPIIATKYGRGGETYPDKYSLNNLRDAVRRSQDRLKRDCIDLLQLHCVPTEVVARGEIFDWLRTVQQEGLIRYFGASVETVEEALICAEHSDLTSLQVIYNIFRQKLRDELLPKAKENQIGIIVRLPLASGMLSGKFDEKTQFASTDHRNFNREGKAFSVGETFAGIPFETGVQLVRELNDKVPEGYTMAQMAMRWLLDQDAVSTIIPGASSAAQVRENVRVSELAPLPESLHNELYEFYQQRVKEHIRGVY
ncbi:aldo/keto reductase [Marinimicrobium sp. ABcell2]|uniref:aldo/keto reductase n=1 Tax=Marinimicrobium sp. ABcell2 TaxID=3069751 RepID=UPI0027B7DA60|nr:aldo/keto reductase [Marinimicrobium sp. ABcell2]MDQ2077179.1 aldo/keto reductase [Marinimicrobium sp. ABcell2]